MSDSTATTETPQAETKTPEKKPRALSEVGRSTLSAKARAQPRIGSKFVKQGGASEAETPPVAKATTEPAPQEPTDPNYTADDEKSTSTEPIVPAPESEVAVTTPVAETTATTEAPPTGEAETAPEKLLADTDPATPAVEATAEEPKPSH